MAMAMARKAYYIRGIPGSGSVYQTRIEDRVRCPRLRSFPLPDALPDLAVRVFLPAPDCRAVHE